MVRCVRIHLKDRHSGLRAGRKSSWRAKPDLSDGWRCRLRCVTERLLWQAPCTLQHQPSVHTWDPRRWPVTSEARPPRRGAHSTLGHFPTNSWLTFQSLLHGGSRNDFSWFVLKKDIPIFLSIVGVQKYLSNEPCRAVLMQTPNRVSWTQSLAPSQSKVLIYSSGCKDLEKCLFSRYCYGLEKDNSRTLWGWKQFHQTILEQTGQGLIRYAWPLAVSQTTVLSWIQCSKSPFI